MYGNVAVLNGLNEIPTDIVYGSFRGVAIKPSITVGDTDEIEGVRRIPPGVDPRYGAFGGVSPTWQNRPRQYAGYYSPGLGGVGLGTITIPFVGPVDSSSFILGAFAGVAAYWAAKKFGK